MISLQRRGIIGGGVLDGGGSAFANTWIGDGSNDYIQCGNDSSLQITGNLTISAWVYINAHSTNVILTKSSYTDNKRAYEFYTTGAGKVTLVVTADGSSFTQVIGSTTLSTSTWYHLAATSDGTDIKVYVNGAEDGSTAFTSAIYNTTTALVIAAYGGVDLGGLPMDGNLSSVGVWNALPSISDLYNSNVALQWGDMGSLQTNCQMFIPINKGVTSGQEYVDQTANSNDGTASGSPVFGTPQLELSS